MSLLSLPLTTTILVTLALLSLPLKNTAIPVMFLLLVPYLCVWFINSLKPQLSQKRLPPKPDGAWPLIGHLHLLRRPQPTHITLADMADKYGPIFTLNLGFRRAIVVSNSEIAKECFTTHDQNFANRPRTLAMEQLSYNKAMFGFGPYGPFWRYMRKITSLELLSSNRLDKFRNAKESEIKMMVKHLYELCSESGWVLVDLKKLSGQITHNVMFRIMVGKHCKEDGHHEEGWKKASREFVRLFAKFVVADSIPFLSWFDLGGDEKAMKRTAKEFDYCMGKWLQEHKKNKRLACNDGSVEEDLMTILLSALDDHDHPQQEFGFSADTINKATILGLILASSETTSATLSWGLSLLLKYPEVLKKAQLEVDTVIGKERMVNEPDVESLHYLEAIIKETLRLYPAAPFAIPHESIEDCTVSGYHIPAGTQLLVNLWKVHRDPNVWDDPYEFRPERFLTTHKEIDVKGRNFELIPFSSGRRICPGLSLAMQVLKLAFANLVHGFDFEKINDEPIDMTESIGLTNFRALSLDAIVNPRLSPHVYC